MSKLVARTRPGLNMGSPNPTRARKKVARPSPSTDFRGGAKNNQCHGPVALVRMAPLYIVKWVVSTYIFYSGSSTNHMTYD